MSVRTEVTLRYLVNDRTATIKVMDSIGPEDCYETHFKAVIHRYVTGEDLFSPVPRSVKDWMIKSNLNI